MPAASVYHYGYPYEQQSGDDEEYCDRQEREQEFQITQAEIDRTAPLRDAHCIAETVAFEILGHDTVFIIGHAVTPFLDGGFVVCLNEVIDEILRCN